MLIQQQASSLRNINVFTKIILNPMQQPISNSIVKGYLIIFGLLSGLDLGKIFNPWTNTCRKKT